MYSWSRISRILSARFLNAPKNLNLNAVSTLVPEIQSSKRSFFAINFNAVGTDLCKCSAPTSNPFRNYAKGKNIKKDNVKGKVVVDEHLISELVNVDSLKSNMEKAVEQLKDDFTKQLSLRSAAGSIESLPVSVDGEEHTLQELAQIVRKNPKTIVINMSTFPQAIPAALKAIEKSGMNLNPQQDGTTLYIPVPKVTKEHRESLAKNAKQIFVKCRTAIRDVQIKHIKQIKRKDKVSEDLARNVEQQIAAIADKYIAQAEKILETKQQELVG